jgi:NAD(P)H-quinone oxidoreductase subunit 5
MPDTAVIVTLLGILVVAAPVALVILLGVSSLLDRKMSEAATSAAVQVSVLIGLLAALAILAYMLASGERYVPIELGGWVVVPHYQFSVKFMFDRLSVPFIILTFVLCGTVGAFASRYMHREPGFNRFFALYALFLLGMVMAAASGTIETLFTGWELVGLSSALLVVFFQERPAPSRNAFWVWCVYRISDAGLLLAAVVVHHLTGEGDFYKLCGMGLWPDENTALTAQQALLVGGLLLVAAAGKSALVPFIGWLPRAMEGPTPSSAVFYGAMSVHLGAFLLLRVSPILEASPALAVAVVVLGLTTAAFASLAGIVQTDIKSALSFASLAQVGLIVAEVGVGLRYVALVHLIGHACLRTLQFIRAPTLLQDYRKLEDAIGHRLRRPGIWWVGLAPARARAWIYRLALERGYLDTFLSDYIARPFVRAFRACDRLERRWEALLSGEPAPDMREDNTKSLENREAA